MSNILSGKCKCFGYFFLILLTFFVLIVYHISKTCIFINTRLTICLFFASLHSAFFPGASLNGQGLGKAADLHFPHTVEM